MLLRLGFTTAFFLFAFLPSLAVWIGNPLHPREVFLSFQNRVVHAAITSGVVVAGAPSHCPPRTAVDSLDEPAPKPIFLQSRDDFDQIPAYNSSVGTREDKKKRPGSTVNFPLGHSPLAEVLVQATQISIQAYTVPPDDRDAPGERPDDPRASPPGCRDETAA